MKDNEPNIEQLYDVFIPSGGLKKILYDWNGLNEELFFAIHNIRHSMYDQAMPLVTKIGNHEFFIYYLSAIAAFALIAILARKLGSNVGMKAHMCKWVGVLSVLLAGYAVMGLTVKILKEEMAYKRPYHEYTSERVTVLESQPAHKAEQSFPSGHSAFSAFMVTALWPVLPIFLRWFSVLLVLGIGWSRIALGVHFPADIIGGICIGIICTLLVRMIVYHVYRKLFNWHC